MFATAEHKAGMAAADLALGRPTPRPHVGAGCGGCGTASGNQAALRAMAGRGPGSEAPSYNNQTANGPKGAAKAPPQAPAQAPPKPAKPAPCAAGAEATAKACIEPVVIADDDGKNPTVAIPASAAKTIWKKCCIELTVSGQKTISKAKHKTMDEDPNTGTPTAQEAEAIKAVGKNNCIKVFVPKTFKHKGVTSKTIAGGGTTCDAGTAHPNIFLLEGAKPEVLAHEIAHALGIMNHADSAGTVLAPSGAHDVANLTDVSASVCTRARGGAPLKTGTDQDCCKKIP